jgi:dihydroorotase
MANTFPPLDNLQIIQKTLKTKSHCIALPISAITESLGGKKLVDIESIRDYVVGFSDDGVYLEDLVLLEEILKTGALVMAHCSPAFEFGTKNPELETRYIESYLKILKKVGGKLHIQHVSQQESVELIRKAKAAGLQLTCETCPHYFTYTAEELDVRTNPPLGDDEDVEAVRRGLADGTIDVIASDYAPVPRITGIAGFKSFIPLSYGLVLSGVLTKQQLKEKISDNPLKILKENAGKYLQPNVAKIK